MKYLVSTITLIGSFLFHDIAHAGEMFSSFFRSFVREQGNDDVEQNTTNTRSLSLKKHGIDVLFGQIVMGNDLHELQQELSLDYSRERTSTGHHVLFAAAVTKKTDILDSILDKMGKNNKIFQRFDRHGNNILHICCALGWEDGISYLLKVSENENTIIRAISSRNDSGVSPYDVAKHLKDKTILKMLDKIIGVKNKSTHTKYKRKDNGYDDDEDFDKSLSNNSFRSKKESFNYIRELSKLLGYDELVMLMLLDEDQLVKRLTTGGNKTLLTKNLDITGNTILHLLVMFGKNAAIRDIVGSSINRSYLTAAVNAKNSHGDTPMHIAVSMNNVNAVVGLLSYNKVNLAIFNKSDVTPLMLGIRNYKQYKFGRQDAYEIIHMMISYKQDRSFPDHLLVADHLGNTAYHLASMQVSLKIIADLIAAGVDVRQLNNKNQTGGDKLVIRNEKIKNDEKKLSIMRAIDMAQRGRHNDAINILHDSIIKYNQGYY